MKPLRLMFALTATLAGILLTAPPAQAGGWAVTVLDPLPQRIEVGRTYTVGYWTLQHGSHPYEGFLDTTGLKLVDDGGRAVTFEGVALREPAHFAAAVALPHAGTWRLHGQQGIFSAYQVGTLTVPGGLALLRPPTPMTMHSDTHWGLIRPPDVAAMAKDETLPANPADLVATAGAPAQQPAGLRSTQSRPDGRGLSTEAMLGTVLALTVLGGALLLGRHRLARAAPWRANTHPR